MRNVNGASKRFAFERAVLRQSQLDAQAKAWEMFEDDQVYCRNCREHFCFGSDLALKHLGLPPRMLLTCRGNLKQIMAAASQWYCPTVTGPAPRTQRRFLQVKWGNELVFKQCQRLAEKNPHAWTSLHVGGLLG